ncbi:arginine--tRNA ligase [Myxococcota bacterium]|nr:arginine--tRNA ligase [Myxococcota bacterium]MBU1497574.1 arginine--tRNA ligase [Myxococcota bacterium]
MNYCMAQIKKEFVKIANEISVENGLEIIFSDSDIMLSPPKIKEHGDLSTNFAMMNSKKFGMPPVKLAAEIVKRLGSHTDIFSAVTTAGPGFINFTLSDSQIYQGLGRILDAQTAWGRGTTKPGRINLEYVSANPTGPMHVGHGRGAAVGDSIARIMRFAGYDVTCEYYLNDAGKQVENLAESIKARYLELVKSEVGNVQTIEFPEDGYHGAYVIDMAKSFRDIHGNKPALEGIDMETLKSFAVAEALKGIKKTLADLDITFEVFYSEKALHESGALKKAQDILAQRGHIYEQDGAVFFRSSNFGDEKDRVLVKSDGAATYFAADIAYHLDKFNRGYTHLIDLWGADHHGYIPRMKASIEAFGHERDDLEVLLVQFVSLVKGDEKLAMGKRSGNFVTLDDLIAETGADVTRWYFVAKSHDVAIDFDLSEALSQDPRENPARYAQYGHARACSILKKGSSLFGDNLPVVNETVFTHLSCPEEIEISKVLMQFPQVVSDAAESRSPHKIANFLTEISRMFNSYYTRYKDDPVLPKPTQQVENWEETWDLHKTAARLAWIECFKTVTGNALNLLGLNAPEYMVSPEEAGNE